MPNESSTIQSFVCSFASSLDVTKADDLVFFRHLSSVIDADSAESETTFGKNKRHGILVHSLASYGTLATGTKVATEALQRQRSLDLRASSTNTCRGSGMEQFTSHDHPSGLRLRPSGLRLLPSDLRLLPSGLHLLPSDLHRHSSTLGDRQRRLRERRPSLVEVERRPPSVEVERHPNGAGARLLWRTSTAPTRQTPQRGTLRQSWFSWSSLELGLGDLGHLASNRTLSSWLWLFSHRSTRYSILQLGKAQRCSQKSPQGKRALPVRWGLRTA